MTDERFAKLSAGYEAEQKGLEGTIKELSEQITQKTDKTINIDRFMKLVKKHTSFEELTPTLLNTFIEKILVHEVEIDAEGKKHQEIEIVYNFIGSVELPEEATHEEASEPVELPKRESRRSKKSAWNTADLHSTLRVSLSLLYFPVFVVPALAVRIYHLITLFQYAMWAEIITVGKFPGRTRDS